MRNIEQQLLRELIKNSKQSDRDIAKRLKVSQPTLTRIRRKLEQNGIIEHYTIIPNFKKMGFELFALTFVKMRSDILSPETMAKAKEYAERFSNAIFASTGEGLGMTGVIMSFEKNYTEYHRHLNQLRLDWKDFTEDIRSFVVGLEEGEFKRFSLTYLKDAPF